MADTEFRSAMRRSESSGRHNIQNELGYMGAYQFGAPRLQDYMNATGEQFNVGQFRNDPALQDRVQAWHEQDILNYMGQNGILDLIGQEVGGVPINPASLIAMGHLGGNFGTRKFIESGGQYNPADKYGTHISDYGQKFSGMNIYGVAPTRSPRPMARPENF